MVEREREREREHHPPPASHDERKSGGWERALIGFNCRE